MKILLIGHSIGPDAMEKHVFSALRALGHEVSHFNIRDVFTLHPKIDRYAQAAMRLLVREPERLHEKKACQFG
jgi:hypothetical protein